MFQLSKSELIEIVSSINDCHGTGLGEMEFIDCALMLFEDIPGLEHCDAHAYQSMLDSLWRIYCDPRS